jgi:hypothetical protein
MTNIETLQADLKEAEVVLEHWGIALDLAQDYTETVRAHVVEARGIVAAKRGDLIKASKASSDAAKKAQS